MVNRYKEIIVQYFTLVNANNASRVQPWKIYGPSGQS